MSSMSQINPSAARWKTSGSAAPQVFTSRSPLLVRLFTAYVRRYLRRHFCAVRLARGSYDPGRVHGPVVVVLNHPSWWDPLVCMVLSELLPGRVHFAPMEAQALGRYRFFERLGFFGVRLGSVAGARDFLRTGRAVLQRPEAALWVAAQGRFTDPRERPPGLRPGVAHLVQGLDVTILPLALEYPFWTERFPEVLARFGTPLRCLGSVAQWHADIETGLAATQDALAAEAQARSPAAFQVVLAGRTGVGGVYDTWRRLRAWLHGVPFRPEHAATEEP